jgi:hypothetical protein
VAHDKFVLIQDVGEAHEHVRRAENRGGVSDGLSAPCKGAELQWERNLTRQLSFQPVAAEGGV